MTKAEIQLVRALADKRGRTEHGLFVAEGEKLIGELRGSHLKVRKIFALEGVFAGPEVETVAPRDMERLSLLKTAANSLAIVETPRYGLDMRSLAGRLTLALDDVQNPGNLGTIVRLADWFGIADIVCSEASADCFNPKVVQATMGAILRVRVHYTDLGAFLHDAGAAGLPVYGTFLEGENIYGTTLTEEGVVVMGNEGRGISQAAARAVTHKLFIPPYPTDRRGSESLNVAMATGIVCSEFRRRAGMGSGKYAAEPQTKDCRDYSRQLFFATSGKARGAGTNCGTPQRRPRHKGGSAKAGATQSRFGTRQVGTRQIRRKSGATQNRFSACRPAANR